MARHFHLEPVGGIAGDMFVAAMLDAVPALTPCVMADCTAVLPQQCRPMLSTGQSGGLAVHRFGLEGSAPVGATDHAALVARIEGAALKPGTTAAALAILHRLAEAEAAVHGVALGDVHFHEIADWDSLMDVVAAGSIAAGLDGARFSVAPLPLGGGTVRTAHGVLPVPAPATVRLLEGFNVVDDGVSGERVTPTGAAILAHLATNGLPPAGRLMASGIGAGTRPLADRPNILRALVLETSVAMCDPAPDQVAVLAFEIDDMTGEEVATAAEHLRAAPAVLDVMLRPGIGKKGRPVNAFQVLARPDAVEEVAALCFDETATIGLRYRLEARKVLAREADEAAGVRVKRVMRPSGRVTAKAEADDVGATEGLEPRRMRARLAEMGRS